jgi:uncharacterized paraquat-inducible protein A
MLSSELLCSLEKLEKKAYIKEDGHPVTVRACNNSGWRRVAVPALIMCTGASLGCAWHFQIMQLTNDFMHHYQYSVLTMVAAMWSDGYVMFATMVGFFLVIMPAIKLMAITIFWFSNVKLCNLHRHNETVKAIGKWSMLDVFTFAFLLFQLASDTIVSGIESMDGVYAMGVYLVLNYTLDIITQCWIPTAIKVAEQ